MPTSHNIHLSAHFHVMTLRVHCIEKCELLCFHTTKSPGTGASTSFLSSLVPLLDLLRIPPSLLIKGPWELSLACPLKSIQAWFITSHMKKIFGGSPSSYCPPVYSLSSSSLKLNLNLPTVPSHLQFTTLLTAIRPLPTSLHWNCSGLSHKWLPALIAKGHISVLTLPDLSSTWDSWLISPLPFPGFYDTTLSCLPLILWNFYSQALFPASLFLPSL